MVSLVTTLDRRQQFQHHAPNSPEDTALMRRLERVRGFATRYQSVMEMTGFGQMKTTRETIDWLLRTDLSDDPSNLDSIYWREDFIRKSGEQNVKEGLEVHRAFMRHFERSKPYLSQGSQKRWLERFYSTEKKTSSSLSLFQEKRAWIMEHMESYSDRWIKVGQSYDEYMKKPAFAAMVNEDGSYALLRDRDAFLDQSYEKRAGDLAEAIACFKARESMRTQLFQDAKGKLSAAAGRKVLADAKVGVWLQRIFESKARAKLIQDFVEGRGTNSLDVLIQRWAEIKQRFDDARSELASRNEETNARGLTIMSEDAFLHMHYDQRVRYVAELEGRLLEAKDIDRAHPTMLKLGYAMDVGDWDDAAELHAEAMLDPTIRPPDRERLKRMERTIRAHLPSKEAQSVEVSNEAARSGMDRALLRMKKTHPECYPLAMQLAKSLHPNRALRQWRQTVYNNIWTRTHGPPYFNDDVARYGASQDAQETTQFLAEHGQDTGMHDSLGAMNADESNIRKKTIQGEKKSKFRPTYLHCDMQSDDVRDTLRKFYEQEQHPALLYWTTFCPHMDHEPMNEERIRELFLLATELRRHSRVLENRGLLYQGIGKPLVKRGATRTTVQSSPSESTWATAG